MTDNQTTMPADHQDDVQDDGVIDVEIVEDDDTTDQGLDLMPYVPTAIAARTSDLRDVATDSWTDVMGDVIRLAQGIYATEFVPKGLRGSVAKTTAAILYGRELGLPPMTALGSTHVIEGTAGISAEAMRALILQAGHELQITENTTSRCVIQGRRRGGTDWTTAVAAKAEFDVKVITTKKGRMKLTEKDNWVNYPAEMLLARATTRLARMVFADVIHGMRSTEELQDMTAEVTQVSAAPATVAPVQAQPTRVQRKARPAPKAAPQDKEDQGAQEEATTAPEPAPERARKAPPAPRPAPPPADASGADSGAPEIVPDPEAGSDHLVIKDRATASQIASIAAHLNGRLGITDRQDRIYWTAIAAELPNPLELESSKDLTQAQASHAVDRLGKIRDRDGLDTLLPKAES